MDHTRCIHTYVHSSNPPIVTFKPNVRANTSKRVAYFKNTHCIYLNLLVSFSLSHCSFLYRTHIQPLSHSLASLSLSHNSFQMRRKFLRKNNYSFRQKKETFLRHTNFASNCKKNFLKNKFSRQKFESLF